MTVAVVQRGCHGRPDPHSEGGFQQDGLIWLTVPRLAQQLCLPLPSALLPPPSLQGRAAQPSLPRGSSKGQIQHDGVVGHASLPRAQVNTKARLGTEKEEWEKTLLVSVKQRDCL